jgi:sulfite exporter TauE/SafE
MHNCHHDLAIPLSNSLFGIEGLGIVVTLFLTGLVGSFTHCIGMCGPFAVAQTSIRLMNIPKNKLSQKARFNASLLLPYYFGKTFTYCLLLILAYFVSENFKNSSTYKYFALFFLVSTALLFVRIAINKNFNLIKIPFLNKFFSNKVDLSHTKGFKGFIAGATLGLIPCGLVYGAIVAALAVTDNLAISLIAIVSFGMATVPGLFITSYFGQYVLSKYSKFFDYLFSAIMILNAVLLLGYALKLV